MPFKVSQALILLCLVSAISSLIHVRHAERHVKTGAHFERTWPEAAKRPPPIYLQRLFDMLTFRGQEVTSEVTGQQTLLRSLLPIKVYHETASYNISCIEADIKFQPTQLILTTGNFSENNPFFSTANISIRVKFRTTEQHHQFIWTKDRSFYVVNMTRFLHRVNSTDETLKLKFSATNTTGHAIPLDLLFDLDLNSPFLLFGQLPLDIPVDLLEQPDSPRKLRRKRSYPEVRSRSSRRSLTSGVGADTTTCRRQEWLVKPSDIGLDDIIAPPLVDLGFCAGKCPFPLLNEKYNYSLHSYFVDRHRILEGLATPDQLPSSSCVSVTYKPLMVMEGAGSGGHIVVVHHNALVDSCGCRY